jgi:hypothetical protein
MTGVYDIGTFWFTAVGVVSAAGIGVLGNSISLRSAPKRRLYYRMAASVALLTTDGAKQGLEVRRGSRSLKDPRIVDITIQSSGRQSIDSTMFDQGRPLSLRLGVPIVEVLKAESEPREQAIPDFRFIDSTLEVGPGVFAPRQVIKFSVLVDGQPSLDLVSHLSDVQIHRQALAPDELTRRRFRYAAVISCAAAVLAFALYINVGTQVAPNYAPHVSAAACYPLTPGKNCYEPGEFCVDSNHGEKGVAGDGEKIICLDNDGWRWEPR